MKNRGQINIATAIIGGISMVLASALTAWATATGSIAQVRTEVVQVTERENNHYAEVQKRLDEISRKLDAAPWAQNKSSSIAN